MLRKLVFSLIIVVCVALIGYYVYYQQQQPETVIIQTQSSAIPSDAIAVIEYHDVKKTWEQLSNGNLFYEELLETQALQSFDQTWELLDSNLFLDPEWSKGLKEQPLIFSIHPLGQNYQYLLSLFIDHDLSEAYIRKKVDGLIEEEIEWGSKTYAGVRIQEFNKDSLTYYCTEHEGYFLWSPSTIVIEKAIRTINNDDSVLNNREFASLKKTASKDNLIHAYINYENLPRFSEQWMLQNDARLLGNKLGSWAQFDVSIKPNSLLLNGFINTNDSLSYFLNCFDGQESDNIALTEVIPSNIAWYIHTSISDPITYGLKMEEYWRKVGKLNGIIKKRNEFQETLNWDIIHFQNLLKDEIALGVLEPDEENISKDYAMFLKIKDEDDVVSVMDSVLSSYKMNTDHQTMASTYRGFKYWHMGYSSLVEVCFGPLFSPIDNPYFILIEDNLIVSNSKSTMKDIVNFRMNEKTLKKDLHYNRFMDNVSTSSNLSVYTNIARAPYYFKNLLKEDAGADIENQIELFRKFQAVSIQYEKYKGDKYYQTIFCKYNPVYKNETNSLWELAVDTSYSAKPWEVVNHYSSEKELLIQDDRNDLYLVSNTGKIIWKKKFDQKLIGQVHQIDKYKNKKLQMLCLTKDKIYLLDRNGELVEGFPISLPSEASSELAVLDYEGNKKYRILVGCVDGKVYNYNVNGTAIQGWNYMSNESPAINELTYFKIKDKDYILSQHKNGKIRLLNRKGEDRYSPNDSIVFVDQSGLIKRGKIEESELIYKDSIGNVMLTTFEGGITNLIDKAFGDIHFVVDEKIRIVSCIDEDIKIFNEKSEIIAEFETEEDMDRMEIHKIPDSDNFYISFVSKDHMVYLYDNDGLLQDGFPLNGSTSRVITNLNADKYMEMIVGDEDGTMYTYTLGF